MSNIELNYRGFKAVVNILSYYADTIERAGHVPTEVGAQLIGHIYQYLVENEGRMSPDSLAIEYADAYEHAIALINDPANGLDMIEMKFNRIKADAVRRYCYAMQSNADSLLEDDTLALEDADDYADTPF